MRKINIYDLKTELITEFTRPQPEKNLEIWRGNNITEVFSPSCIVVQWWQANTILSLTLHQLHRLEDAVGGFSMESDSG